MSLKFKVGDYVRRKIGWVGKDNFPGVKMFVYAIRNADNYQGVEKIKAREFPIGCRWLGKNNELQLEWLAIEELEKWTE